ncbi:MAG: YraN family protein [Betaproteobacteria bacterium]|uniref:YraN family protein n=1 Tax=Thiomonas TaxID=32012 RepID=UPI000B8E8115|nr:MULTISPECIES: YraN family protein [Thiomonas]MDE2130869.1 YraN family protein [Betaproteobacteria bacterium]OZB44291.1 MAG: YraN family protein [Thiomonas sp. 15-66-11]OZB54775.1 MAG: YraN family protein [Thiomonas sp. 14-66-4]OZB60973.1 MAG: YraN family protein [Thiomonas sp. 13-66-29]
MERFPAKPAARPPGRVGALAEEAAWGYLQRQGLQLVERNYRVRGGEIDIIARLPSGMLVFVEVRSRASAAYGGAGASVDARKRARILLAARHYLMRFPAEMACRFDVVAIEAGALRWIENAFDAGDG